MRYKVIQVLTAILLLSAVIMAAAEANIDDFRMALSGNNAKEFKRLIAPGGLILIRTYNKNRGQDILYRTSDIPADFQITVAGGAMPFDIRYLFGGTLRAKDLVTLDAHIAGLTFNDASVSAVRAFCQKVLNLINQKGRGFTPTLVLDGQYLILTEADVNNELLSGSVAIFMRTGNEYALKAVIDLR